jgi:hypothetical protein
MTVVRNVSLAFSLMAITGESFELACETWDDDKSQTYLYHTYYTQVTQKVMQHIYFLIHNLFY